MTQKQISKIDFINVASMTLQQMTVLFLKTGRELPFADGNVLESEYQIEISETENRQAS